ncbi:MAG: SPOR domain-containing protein, partial [Campylobacter sp.]|nr:SPOR domain-containing protein [Campylobacter sp.]
ILPPEPLNTQASNDNSFENVPITQNESPEDQFEALRRQIEGETNSQTNVVQNNAAIQDNANFTTPNEEIPAQPEPEQIPQQTPPAPKAAEPASPKPQVQPSKPKEQPKQTPKEQPKKTDTKELFKKVEAKESPKDGLVPGLYVQIFSVNNLDQKSKELAEVKKKGYDYKLYKTSVNGKEMTKVLIGPFDKNTIASELEKIRKEVAKEAFSFTLK